MISSCLGASRYDDFANDLTDQGYFFLEKTFIKTPIKMPTTSPIAIQLKKPMLLVPLIFQQDCVYASKI
ncbi:hypothetical protein OOA_11638 [Providencia burhodogranariea DSM 19968]|uniref:Uncharacterized protein n=1 Tax=Providencia burhodogranariea DSM 19968 TaxID=1141662 RepID=K8WL29_9GAMM|nr:hypothetical protein OOA_11638 [Providencia burhodogranariea DSM 19968]